MLKKLIDKLNYFVDNAHEVVLIIILIVAAIGTSILADLIK